MTLARLLLALAAAAFIAFTAAAQATPEDSLPYFQSPGFNVPRLQNWEEQSSGENAQFYLAAASATIRTALVSAAEAPAAVEAALAAGGLPQPFDAPLYSGKVNLADGTWTNIVYAIDQERTASAMARRAGDRFVVISFVEEDPAARTVMLTLPRADEETASAAPEISAALAQFADAELAADAALETVPLPSGRWSAYRGADAQALGMVFGNDSYVALQTGTLGELAPLADAYNRTLLGFFITPDNSAFLALGLVTVFLILGTLLLSFWWRARGIRQDFALLQALEREDG